MKFSPNPRAARTDTNIFGAIEHLEGPGTNSNATRKFALRESHPTESDK